MTQKQETYESQKGPKGSRRDPNEKQKNPRRVTKVWEKEGKIKTKIKTNSQNKSQIY